MPSPAGPTWPTVLGRLAAGLDLDSDSAAWAVAQGMSGEATPAQVGAFLLGLQAKGPTAREVAAAAAVMRDAALPITVPG
ncbi:MAG: anthranilate phosphoribosyltransferase, partial [Actinomycetota bacterium]